MKKELIFVSRHKANDGQIALAKKMGYKSIRQIVIEFSKDPINDLENAEIDENVISIVAPGYITNQLLNAGYTLIEFVNSPIKRQKTVFCCEGAYKYTLIQGFPARINQEYIPCPIPIEKQYESSLI